MAITVYRSDDVGAPLLEPSTGSFNSLLKSILVDGYGSNASAGWSVELEDVVEGKTIFKNSTSKLFYVQHDTYNESESKELSTGFKYAYISGINGYKDINTLIDTYPNDYNSQYPDFYTPNDIKSSKLRILLSTSDSYESGITWIAFADSKTFYILIYTDTYLDLSLDPTLTDFTDAKPHNVKMYGFGDYSIIGDDPNEFNGFVSGGDVNSTADNTISNYFMLYPVATSSNFSGYLQRNSIGDVGGVEFSARSVNTLPIEGRGGRNYGVTENQYVRYPTTDGNIGQSKILLTSYNMAKENSRYLSADELIVGYYRGFDIIHHTLNPSFDNIGNWGDTYTMNGRNYMLISFGATESAWDLTFSVDLTGWD